MVFKLRCKPICNSIKSRFDNFRTDPKVKVLSEQIEHHVHEEEKRSDGIFSQALAAGLDMDELGDLMKGRKKALLAEYKTSGISAPETRTFTGHTLEQGEPVERNQSVCLRAALV